MSDTERTPKYCAAMEGHLSSTWPGRAMPATARRRRALAGCSACRNVQYFRARWARLDDLPVMSPSPAFDASLPLRIAAEPVLRSSGLATLSRLAFCRHGRWFAMSVWMASLPRIAINDPEMTGVRVGRFRNYPGSAVLENYEFLPPSTRFPSACSATSAVPGEVTNDTRE